MNTVSVRVCMATPDTALAGLDEFARRGMVLGFPC
jgi:hypothetical protein